MSAEPHHAPRRRASMELTDLVVVRPPPSRRRSLTKCPGTRSLLSRSRSEENLMAAMMSSCESLESLNPEMLVLECNNNNHSSSRRTGGKRRSSLSRSNGVRPILMRSGSSDNLMISEMSLRSLESSIGVGEAVEKRRGGLRRSHSSRTMLTQGTQSSSQLSWHGSLLDLNNHERLLQKPPSQRRSSMSSMECNMGSEHSRMHSLHKSQRRGSHGSTRFGKTTDPLSCRHNSVSTMSTTGLVMDEVDALMEEIKQAIRQKVSREVTLQKLIASNQALAKARYLSDNAKGAILSMRRVHRFQSNLQHVETVCARLVQLRQELDATTSGGSNNNGLLMEIGDLGELQDRLEQALDMHNNHDTTTPVLSDDEFLREVQKLVGMVEI